MIRLLDILFSFLGIVLLSPLFTILCLLIMLESKGGAIYKQIRVGKDGIDFELYKFRSMQIGADKKGLITVGGKDPRVTKIGYFIRMLKLDELPQLFNVLKGDMSLVGPRPEVRKYVDLYTVEQRKVLSVRPGITDYASIEYIDENELLGKSDDPESVYIQQIIPDKIAYNMRYINNRNINEYIRILFLTVRHVLVKSGK